MGEQTLLYSYPWSLMIVVLGIDALEYDLVEEWNLQYLKQRAYCKTDLSEFGVIITPLIWASMLTGKKIEKIEKMFLKRARFFSERPQSVKKNEKQYTAAKIAAKILPKSAKMWIIRNIIPNPFDKTKDYLIKHHYKTVFDYFENPWTNGVPTYGKNVADKKTRELMNIAASGHPEILYKEALKIYKKDKKELLDALDKEHDFIFWYTSFLDEIEHFYITKKLKLLKVYMDLNSLVREISEILSKNDKLYIISDHGMAPVEDSTTGFAGEHSDHGFFSSSTGELIKRPQDLYGVITKER